MRLLCKSGRSQRGLASLLKSLTFMPASNYIDGVYVRPQEGGGERGPLPRRTHAPSIPGQKQATSHPNETYLSLGLP